MVFDLIFLLRDSAYALYNFVRGFGWVYKWSGLYPEGLISGIKKNRSEMSHGSVDRNTFEVENA